MQITRETDYAIRCVYYLKNKPDEVTMVDEIAREMCIPKSFLAKILQKLSRAKIVQSYRGVKGGFQLARKPKNISIYDVIEAVEGPIAMNVCAVDRKQCGLSDRCKIYPIWVEVKREVKNMLKNKKFSQI